MARVLVIFEHTSLNGGERSLLTALEYLQNRAGSDNFSIHAIAPPAGPLIDALDSLRIETHPLTFVDERQVRRSQEDLRSEIDQLVRRLAPDLLHANSLSTARLTGPVSADCGVPSIGHLRDILQLSRAAVDDLNHHTRLVAVSEATREFHVRQGLDPAKTHVTYNGVDLQRFHPRRPTRWLHQELRLPGNAILVGGVGQIILRKGWDVWLEAAATVINAHPDVHFVLIGQRHSTKAETLELEQTLLNTTRQSPWQGHLHLLGTRDRMEKILPEFTVYAHPARQEPFGRVLLEAAACAVPVVATDVGGTRELFGDATAVLIPPDDAQQLTEGILDALRQPAIAMERAKMACQRVSTRFDQRQAAEKMVGHYRAVLEERQRSTLH